MDIVLAAFAVYFVAGALHIVLGFLGDKEGVLDSANHNYRFLFVASLIWLIVWLPYRIWVWINIVGEKSPSKP